MVEPVKVTLELGQYSSRQVRLFVLLNGGTLTNAAKAMVDLGCSLSGDRIDQMTKANMPHEATDVKLWQDTLLAGEFNDL